MEESVVKSLKILEKKKNNLQSSVFTIMFKTVNIYNSDQKIFIKKTFRVTIMIGIVEVLNNDLDSRSSQLMIWIVEVHNNDLDS